MPLLAIRELTVDFATERGRIRALDAVSFELAAGETLGLVGESGCGKTVTALSILRLLACPPGQVVGGRIELAGQDLLALSERQMRQVRGKEIAVIFQEPMTALNPVYTIGQQLVDVLGFHQKLGAKAARQKALAQLEIVGIAAPEQRFDEYPHRLSGGMRQRVMIAMALACGPKVLLADEPTTALDVTTQAQILDEIRQLQQRLKMGMILVSHDLGVIAETCTRVVVMYCGQVIEVAEVAELFARPRHPYTNGLLASVPRVRTQRLRRLPTIAGVVPDLRHLPPGCRFSDRCPQVKDECRREVPRLVQYGQSMVACFQPQA